MKKILSLLVILLVLQIGLIVLTNSSRQQLGAYVANEPLLNFQPAEIDTIDITGPDGQAVVLKKAGGTWRIADGFDAPADASAVDDLLHTLAGLKKGLPVATTKDAAVRFKVAADAFERDIVLKKGTEKKAELLVGTSPMFRKVHVRLPGSDDIISVTFAANDAGVQPTDWLDRAMLTFDAGKITDLTIGPLHLQRKGKTLVPDDLAPGETVKAEAVTRLVNSLAGMRVEAVLGNSDKPEYGLDKPELTCSFVLASDKKQTWRFGKPEKEQYHVLKSSNSDLFFKVADSQVQPLLNADRNALIQTAATTGSTDNPQLKQRKKPDTGN